VQHFFHIVKSDVIKNTYGTHFCVSITKTFMRTRHAMTLHVHCLCCFLFVSVLGILSTRYSPSFFLKLHASKLHVLHFSRIQILIWLRLCSNFLIYSVVFNPITVSTAAQISLFLVIVALVVEVSPIQICLLSLTLASYCPMIRKSDK
jgi:hypothetical protein